MYVCMHVLYIGIYRFVCMHVCMLIIMYVCRYVCMYVYASMDVCVYITRSIRRIRGSCIETLESNYPSYEPLRS